MIADGDSVTFDVFGGMFGETLLDATVTVTNQEAEGESSRTVAIDLGRLFLGATTHEYSYIEFDGAINVKVA